MQSFTRGDIRDMFADLKLYSGHVKSIKMLHGPYEAGGWFDAVLRTSMDSFRFTADPRMCAPESWTISFADPVNSLVEGHRMLRSFTFPKIHLNRELKVRYTLANCIYRAYNGVSRFNEADRLKEHERLLGYEALPSHSHVVRAIIKDFRSYKQKRQREERAGCAKN